MNQVVGRNNSQRLDDFFHGNFFKFNHFSFNLNSDPFSDYNPKLTTIQSGFLSKQNISKRNNIELAP